MASRTPETLDHRCRRALTVVVVGLWLLGAGAGPGAAQTDDTEPADPSTTTAAETTTTGVSEEDQELIDSAEARKAVEVDAASAELGDLNEALEALQSQVADQEAEVDYAGVRLAEAEQAVISAESEVAAAEAELVGLRQQVGEMAVRAFVGEAADSAALFLTTADPTEAVRMENLLAEVTRTDLDLLDQLQVAQDDLLVQQADATVAVEEAAGLRAESEAALSALQQDREAQTTLAASAEDRLDQLLAERAALAQIGADIDAGNPVDDLAALLASSPTATAPSGDDVAIPDLVSEAEIVDVGKGIEVHQSIADQVRQLLADADAAGVDLAGGGYRSPASQIAVRKANCGTSDYAIYEMPASQCSPPTARPGRSMHEKGLAIDFTYNGNLIRSRSGPGWSWLAANAARYGLSNLPSEPWHWSTNGN
jgi:LAS superfamily LD-carboxypeptidase LdcB